MQQLFERTTSPGGKVSYRPFTPVKEEPTVIEMTDTQMLTCAAALGVTLLTLYERCLPPHKRIARKVKAVEDAVISLYAGVGEKVDHETLEWFAKMWDSTMRNAEHGEVVRHA